MADTLDKRARYIAAFAASVSHEFKTPLAALGGAAELLEVEDGAGAAPEGQRLLRIVADSTARLNLLVTRMLDLARADMTRPQAGPAMPVDAVLDSVADLYRLRGLTIVRSGASVSTTLPAPALEAILVSLVDNALIHGGRTATVHMRTVRTPGQPGIEISDDGPGITAAHRSRVFDPFFTSARDSSGTGLGLPIARAILTGAGGGLDLVPTETGSRFLMVLPDSPI